MRMSTVFRKVTNGCRSQWGRDRFAAVRSVVNTGKRQGLSASGHREGAFSYRLSIRTGLSNYDSPGYRTLEFQASSWHKVNIIDGPSRLEKVSGTD